MAITQEAGETVNPTRIAIGRSCLCVSDLSHSAARAEFLAQWSGSLPRLSASGEENIDF